MKKTRSIISILLCMIALLCLYPSSAKAAENDAFKIRMSIDKNVQPGDTVNVVCSVDDIVSETGLCGISFTFTYDTKILEPLVVSENAENTSPYDAFMTKVPTYTLSAGDKDVQASAYENISRCYPSEGKYTFMFVDMLVYPGIKSGTTVDSVLRNNGDLTISVPFKVKEGTPYGSKAVISITKAVGTTAGENMRSVYTSDSSIILHLKEKGAEVITTTAAPETRTSGSEAVESSGTNPNKTEINTSGSSGNSSESKAQPSGNTVSAAESSSGTEEKTKSSSALIIVLAIISLVAVAAVIFVYLRKKNK